MSYYIYYQPATGNILAVANEIDSSFGDHYIETDLETYCNFGNNVYIIHEWAVLSSPKDDQVVELVKRVQEVKEFDPDKSLKQIEKVDSPIENAFIIKQNIVNGSWSVETTLDDKTLIYLSQTSGYAEQFKEIYVIKEDNPNILLDTFVIEFKDLLTNSKYDVKVYNKPIAQRTDIGLICSRVDEEFVHIAS